MNKRKWIERNKGDAFFVDINGVYGKGFKGSWGSEIVNKRNGVERK